jgi:hypothetical protein
MKIFTYGHNENMLKRTLNVPKPDKRIMFRKKLASTQSLRVYSDELAYCA